MSTITEAKPWDFSAVYELVNSLSARDAPSLPRNGYRDPQTSTGLADLGSSYGAAGQLELGESDNGDGGVGLGNFGKVWQYLGVPPDVPVPKLPHSFRSIQNADSIPAKSDYASDGAIDSKSKVNKGKSIRTKEDSSADDTAGNFTDQSLAHEEKALTKNQRKKKNRKERKEQEKLSGKKSAAVSESEAELTGKGKAARTASAHTVLPEPKSSNSRNRDGSFKAVTALSTPQKKSAPQHAASLSTVTPKTAHKQKDNGKKNLRDDLQTFISQPDERPNPSTPKYGSTAVNSDLPSHPATAPTAKLSSIPFNAQVTSFTPSTVQPKHNTAAGSSQQQFQQQVQQAVSNVQHAISGPENATPSKKGAMPQSIQPKIIRSGEDRNWALLIKLIGDFFEDRKYLISPMNLTTHNNDPNGIHVFVDASNIFIGFNDQLKRARGIHPLAHIPQANLSFDALALLMERRRPVAKRVLAGSTPHLPAFDKAKAVGYECNILDKVYKAKELTDRQIYFKAIDRGDRETANRLFPNGPPPVHSMTNGSIDGLATQGSGSETTAPVFAPAKMIEQGVDEILHLKILESIVDAETPSTIVLATGDAAQAEYSQGFMKMAERALIKGWKVELVSWSKNISSMYKRKEWTAKWDDRFKVITLDDYAEELLDM